VDAMYDSIVNRVGEKHPILIRAVLVKKIVEIAKEAESIDSFIYDIGSSDTDFFSTFVKGIIEREAVGKWINRDGDIASPVLTVDQHCGLLGCVAFEMWVSGQAFIKQEEAEIAAEMYCDSEGVGPSSTYQVK